MAARALTTGLMGPVINAAVNGGNEEDERVDRPVSQTGVPLFQGGKTQSDAPYVAVWGLMSAMHDCHGPLIAGRLLLDQDDVAFGYIPSWLRPFGTGGKVGDVVGLPSGPKVVREGLHPFPSMTPVKG